MTQGSCNQKRTLVVEDEAVICRVCQKVLMSEGLEVQIAINGLEAKKMVRKRRYDLYLIDIRTPKMSGIELYVYLQKKYPDSACKVVFTTGDVFSDAVDSFLQKVNRPFLSKPITPDELRWVVREVLKQDVSSQTQQNM